MAASIIHFLGYQAHQPNTSPTIHQIYVPLNLYVIYSHHKIKPQNTDKDKVVKVSYTKLLKLVTSQKTFYDNYYVLDKSDRPSIKLD